MPSIEDTPWAPASTTAATSTSFSWWGLFITFLIFLTILFVALWLIRRLNQSAVRGINVPWVRVLDRQILGGQQSLYLVEVAGKLQVLGGSDHHLVKISEIEDPDLAAEILEEIVNRPTEKVEGILGSVTQKLFGKQRRKKDDFSVQFDKFFQEVDR